MFKLAKNAKDKTGKRFGMLVALRPIGRRKDKIMWECVCDCGNIKAFPSSELREGGRKSCGCNQHPIGITRNRTHGLSYTRLYNIFSGMHSRCSEGEGNSKKRYYNRGIRVCDEWSGDGGLQNFVEWAFQNGYEDGLTIDRIDVNGNYEPSNCRWATFKEQCNNRTTSRYITCDGVTKTMAEWADSLGLKHNTLYNRLKAGWSVEDALFKPVKGRAS